jgi:hypothetical protein
MGERIVGERNFREAGADVGFFVLRAVDRLGGGEASDREGDALVMDLSVFRLCRRDLGFYFAGDGLDLFTGLRARRFILSFRLGKLLVQLADLLVDLSMAKRILVAPGLERRDLILQRLDLLLESGGRGRRPGGR